MKRGRERERERERERDEEVKRKRETRMKGGMMYISHSVCFGMVCGE